MSRTIWLGIGTKVIAQETEEYKYNKQNSQG